MPSRLPPSRLQRPPLRPQALVSVLALVAGLLAAGAVQAEKADRNKPMVVESDGKQAASVDLAKKLTVITGNVSIAQGSLLIKAERVEVREPQASLYTAVAFAPAGGAATFRQKRDRPGEVIEGQADRIEYDGITEKVHLIGNAQLRMLRDGQPADHATAATIVYDQRLDTVVFEGSGQVSPGATSNRVQMVFLPRAASEPASAASGAGQ